MLVFRDTTGFESSGAYGDPVDVDVEQRSLVYEARQAVSLTDDSPSEAGPIELPLYSGSLDLAALVNAKDIAIHIGCADAAAVRRRVKKQQVLVVSGRAGEHSTRCTKPSSVRCSKSCWPSSTTATRPTRMDFSPQRRLTSGY